MGSKASVQASFDVIVQFNKKREELEARFTGLPHTHTTLIKSLITKADPRTGMVDDFSYRDLSNLLRVEVASGRKNTGIIQKQTIRSYLRTIEKEYPNEFRVISEGQCLRLQFLSIPLIYSSLFDLGEMYTDSISVKSTKDPIDFEEKNTSSEEDEGRDNIREVNTVSPAVKNINILNINNKQTTNARIEKKSISDDFYPDAKTIELAQSRGFSKVIDPEEIRKFILHNQARRSLWEDYNPVFMLWLEHDFNPQNKISNREFLGGHHNERRLSSNYQRKPTMQDLYAANRHAAAPSGKLPVNTGEICIDGEYSLVVDSISRDLWKPLHL